MDVLTNAFAHEQILKALASSSAYGADASALIPEDLEVEAANQLYNETSPIELTLLKDMPRKPATNVIHQFSMVKSYGSERNDGFFPESGLPTYTNQNFVRKSVNIKIMGEYAAVNLIAQLENSIKALGQGDLVGIENAAKMLLLQHKVNRAMYFADADATAHDLRYDGIKALVTKNATADHVIDLRGGKLTPDKIRQAAKLVATYHGVMTSVYLSLDDKELVEKQLDSAERLNINRFENNRVMMGQNVDGMFTQGGAVYFRPDNTLSPIHANFGLPTDFPSNVPAVLSTVTSEARSVSGSEVSKWIAGDAGSDIIYHVTALNEVGESSPKAVTALAVSAGQAVDVTITPRATDKSFRIYRSSAAKGIDPSFIKEVPHTAGDTTPIVFTDLNQVIPGTRVAFGLSMRSTNFNRAPGDASMKNLPLPQNTVCAVELTKMSIFTELAKLGLLASNDIIFWPHVMEMTHPYQNVVFINVGNN